jgi:multiple sugar transport system permease protein
MTGSRALGYAFVAPTLAFLVLFNVYPLLYNIVLSFTDAKLSGGAWDWVGGRNYARVFAANHAEYPGALRTTALFVACAVTIELLLGFALALALKRPFRGKTAVLTLLLTPMMLSPAVMGLYWTLILNSDYGILDQGLGALGLPQPRWLIDTAWAPGWKFVSIVLVDVWMWTPFMMLIALAGLNAIPPHLYEAAEIDRASTWTTFRRITLPLCAPLLILAVLLRATDALKQFDLVMAMTGPNEGTTQTVSALLYQIEFKDGKVGLGSAYACVALVVVIALATVFTRYLDWLARRQGRTS